jgi:hypothetical protein
MRLRASEAPIFQASARTQMRSIAQAIETIFRFIADCAAGIFCRFLAQRKLTLPIDRVTARWFIRACECNPHTPAGERHR